VAASLPSLGDHEVAARIHGRKGFVDRTDLRADLVSHGHEQQGTSSSDCGRASKNPRADVRPIEPVVHARSLRAPQLGKASSAAVVADR